jgi:selenide,water dikinase
LDQVLASVPRWADENVLIGFDTADDAGVYKLTAELALVQTVDFFTPIVDDPYTFGAIAAANALSDVYAMGGRPISALSVVAYPAKGDVEDLEQILKGGAEKMHEADCSILGGHSVADDEIKFGYAVTGAVHPARVTANAGALARRRAGVHQAPRHGRDFDRAEARYRGAGARGGRRCLHAHLNRRACEEMLRRETHGCTDVTGFGLLGHAREMALASGVTLEIETDRGALSAGRARICARWAPFPAACITIASSPPAAWKRRAEIPREVEDLLYDPQTSGGLLIALAEEDAAAPRAALEGAYRIGRVLPRGEKPIRLI